MRIRLEHTDELISRRGGMILFHEYVKRLYLAEMIDESFGAPGSNRGLKASNYVLAQMELLIDGGCHLDDIRFLEADAAYKKLIERTSYPSSDALGDWLRRHGEEGAKKISVIINDLVARRTEKQDNILDIDTTMIVSEKGDALRGYTSDRGYNPLLAACVALGLFFAPRFQQGNVSPQTDLVSYIKACRAATGNRLQVLRSDSAAYNHMVINYCDGYERGEKKREKMYYTITADQDVSVIQAVRKIPFTAWKHIVDEKENEWYQIAETVHTMNKTNEAFRLVIKRTQNKQTDLFEDYRYWIVSTNYPRNVKNTHEVLLHHEDRGAMERMIGELKTQVQLESLPCGQFSANSLYFAIGVLAYNLLSFMKQDYFPTAYKRISIRRMRYMFFHLPVWVISHAGYLIARIAVVRDLYDDFREVYRNIRMIARVRYSPQGF